MTEDAAAQAAVMPAVQMVKVSPTRGAFGLVLVGRPRGGEAGDRLGRIDRRSR